MVRRQWRSAVLLGGIVAIAAAVGGDADASLQQSDGPPITARIAALPGVNSVLTTTPLLIGAPVGLVAGAAVFRAFANRIGAFPDPAFPFVLVVSMMIRLIVVANLVAVMPTRRAQRLSAAQLLQVD